MLGKSLFLHNIGTEAGPASLHFLSSFIFLQAAPPGVILVEETGRRLLQCEAEGEGAHPPPVDQHDAAQSVSELVRGNIKFSYSILSLID